MTQTLTLSTLSARFNMIFFRTTPIWTSIRSDCPIEAVKSSLIHSKNAPLDVFIEPSLKNIDLIASQSHRWRSLELWRLNDIRQTALTQLVSSRTLPSIQTLTLHSPETRSNGLSPASFPKLILPNLQSLHTDCVPFAPSTITAQLTQLTLKLTLTHSEPVFARLVTDLNNARRLVNLKITYKELTTQSDTYSTEPEPLTLPFLRHVQLHCSFSARTTSHMFKSISWLARRLPLTSLNALDVKIRLKFIPSFPEFVSNDVQIQFFHNTPSFNNLKHLTLSMDFDKSYLQKSLGPTLCDIAKRMQEHLLQPCPATHTLAIHLPCHPPLVSLLQKYDSLRTVTRWRNSSTSASDFINLTQWFNTIGHERVKSFQLTDHILRPRKLATSIHSKNELAFYVGQTFITYVQTQL